jgi:hypothetical protein
MNSSDKRIISLKLKVKGKPVTKKCFIIGIHPNMSTLNIDKRLNMRRIDRPHTNTSTDFDMYLLSCKQFLTIKKNTSRIVIERKPTPSLPSNPQNDVHLSNAKTLETRNESRRRKKDLSYTDFPISILPLHIHLIISSRMISEDMIRKKVTFICSV